MAEVSFGKGQTPVVDVVATVTPESPAAAPAVAAPAAPAAPAAASVPTVPAVQASLGVPAAGPTGLVLGDKLPDFKDIILPRINLVQNIGGLTESFESGMIVLNQATVLFMPPIIDTKTGKVEREASPPVNIVVFGFRPTRYSEKVAGGAKGLIVDTEDAVRASGGTLDYAEWNLKKASGMKRFEPLADALVAIQRPANCADDDTVFVYDVDGAKYALALWAMKGTSYTAAAKRVFFTARMCGCLRKGYPTWSYALTCREQKYETGNAAWVPVCIPIKQTTPAFLEFVKSIIGG